MTNVYDPDIVRSWKNASQWLRVLSDAKHTFAYGYTQLFLGADPLDIKGMTISNTSPTPITDFPWEEGALEKAHVAIISVISGTVMLPEKGESRSGD